MKPTSDLDPLLRRVLDSPKPAPGYQLVIINDKGELSNSPRSWLGGRSGRSFLIGEGENPEAVARVKGVRVVLEDFKRQRCLPLLIDYEVRSVTGQERRAVQVLADADSPQEALERRIRRWTLDYARASRAEDDPREGVFIDHYYGEGGRPGERERLSEHLRNRAKAEVGLQLTPRIGLENEEYLHTETIGPIQWEVITRDWGQKVNVKVTIELPVDSGARMEAYLRFPAIDAVKEAIKAEALAYFKADVALHQLQDPLLGTVVSGLAAHIDRRAREEHFGRLSGRITLQPNLDLTGVVPHARVEHEFLCALPEYPDPVKVKSTVTLQLADLGSYFRANKPVLDEWTRRQVERLTGDLLLKVDYTELCETVEAKKKAIEAAMIAQGAHIGYEVRQVVTLTDLQFDTLKEPFPVEVEADFPTRIGSLQVRLGVYVTTRIPDPRSVSQLLNRRLRVIDAMRERIHALVRQELHGVDPKEFYTEFEQRPDGLPSVAQRLHRQIEAALRERFGIDVGSTRIAFKQMENEILIALKELDGPPCNFLIEVPPWDNKPPIRFEGSFNFDGVVPDRWDRFASCCKLRGEIAAISRDVVRECVEKLVTAQLSELAEEMLLSFTNNRLMGQIVHYLRERIADQLGISVTLTHWRRLQTEAGISQVVIERHLIAAREADQKREIDHLLQFGERDRGEAMNRYERLLAARAEQEEEFFKALHDGLPEVEERRTAVGRLDAELAKLKTDRQASPMAQALRPRPQPAAPRLRLQSGTDRYASMVLDDGDETTEDKP